MILSGQEGSARMRRDGGPKTAADALVSTVRVAVAGLVPSSVSAAGEIVQVASAGAPAQLNETC